MAEGGVYSPAAIPGKKKKKKTEDPFSCMNELGTMMTMTKKKNTCNNQRRFSDEQIKSLELMFESETRLEPRKKIQVARELGLQPRQIAIWFQNKRARRKSKELEKDYSILRSEFNNLASKFEDLKKEKQALASELQRLNDKMQSCKEEGDGLSGTSHEPERGENVPPERYENGSGVLSDDDNIKTEYFGFEEDLSLMGMVEPDDSCLTSSDEWGCLKSDVLLDQSRSSYPWWDVWS